MINLQFRVGFSWKCRCRSDHKLVYRPMTQDRSNCVFHLIVTLVLSHHKHFQSISSHSVLFFRPPSGCVNTCKLKVFSSLRQITSFQWEKLFTITGRYTSFVWGHIWSVECAFNWVSTSIYIYILYFNIKIFKY